MIVIRKKSEEQVTMNNDAKRRRIFVYIVLMMALLSVSFGGITVIAQDISLRIAYGSDLDPADVADLMGLDLLEDMGYSVEIIELNSDSSAVAGMIRGDIDVSSMGLPDAIKAFHVGVPLRVIMPSNMVFEFVLIGQPGISTVEDMAGQRVAYHGPGSGTEILPRMLVRQSDAVTEDDMEWIILPESPNRAAAMQAERIDVTALEFADVLTLREDGRDYQIIGSFSDIAPEAFSTAWVAIDSYAEENPDIVNDLAAALAMGYAEAAADKDAWMAKALDVLPIPEERLSETYDFYVDIGNFPAAPYYTEENWQAMNDFFISVGEFEDPGPFDMVVTDAIAAAVEAAGDDE
jgi:ABC-type nitrate/sulfonate/bicarbonate transport system substrate-binding protein